MSTLLILPLFFIQKCINWIVKSHNCVSSMPHRSSVQCPFSITSTVTLIHLPAGSSALRATSVYFKSCRPLLRQVASCSARTSCLFMHLRILLVRKNASFLSRFMSSMSVNEPSVGAIEVNFAYIMQNGL